MAPELVQRLDNRGTWTWPLSRKDKQWQGAVTKRVQKFGSAVSLPQPQEHNKTKYADGRRGYDQTAPTLRLTAYLIPSLSLPRRVSWVVFLFIDISEQGSGSVVQDDDAYALRARRLGCYSTPNQLFAWVPTNVLCRSVYTGSSAFRTRATGTRPLYLTSRTNWVWARSLTPHTRHPSRTSTTIPVTSPPHRRAKPTPRLSSSPGMAI
jgi:hypothetical protein